MSRRLFTLLVFGAMLTVMVSLAGVASTQTKPPADTKKPTITNLSPAAGSTTIDRTPTIGAVIKDNKTNLAKKHIRLYVDGNKRAAFSYNRNTDRLTYTTPRLSLGGHAVKVTARDAAGNRAVKAWKFRVIRKAPEPPVIAPVVTSTNPADGATGVGLDSNIQVTFSQDMDPATFIDNQTFELHSTYYTYDELNPPDGQTCGFLCFQEPLTVSYDPVTRTATLDPASSLLPNTQYTAVVEGADDSDGRAVTNEAGTPMARDHIFYFTTGDGGCGAFCEPS